MLLRYRTSRKSQRCRCWIVSAVPSHGENAYYCLHCGPGKHASLYL